MKRYWGTKNSSYICVQTLFDAKYFGNELLSAVSISRVGVVCRLVPWSQISDPLLDSSAAPPAALSLHTCLPLCPHKPVCLFLGCPCSSVCLLLFLYSLPCLLSVCMFLSLSLIFCLHLADEDVNINLSLKSDHTEDDSNWDVKNVIKGVNSKRCCLHETNNYCQLKIAGFHSFASLFWFLN